jgi:hypothetical protein
MGTFSIVVSHYLSDTIVRNNNESVPNAQSLCGHKRQMNSEEHFTMGEQECIFFLKG